MAAANLLALLDDIATMLDDIAVMSKMAAKKTAGVLGDDLALNANQVQGVKPDREIPVVMAVAKGSFINKLILVPAALLISAFVPVLITILLVIGGLYLCFEGAEKLLHKWFFSHDDEDNAETRLNKLSDSSVDLVAMEKNKINNINCKYWLISYNGKNIGLVNIADIDYTNKRCTVGYYIGEKDFVGLGTMFLPPVYDYVFYKIKLNKIYGEFLDGNNLILGIHKYHGWRNVGVYKNHVIKSGKYFDVHLVELLSTEWKNYRTRKGNKEKDSVFKSYELFEQNDGIDDSI